MLLRGIWQNNSGIYINEWITKNCQHTTKEDQRGRLFLPDVSGYNKIILIKVMWYWYTERNIKQGKEYNG